MKTSFVPSYYTNATRLPCLWSIHLGIVETRRDSSITGLVRICLTRSPLAAVGVGAKDFFFPTDIGFPLSGSSGSQYVVMATSYYNPTGSETLTDNSGIKLYYTPVKRPTDAYSMEVGHTISLDDTSIFLPPRMSNVVTETVCPAECTRVGLPSAGVTAFASFLHAHSAGKSIRLKHIRNETELPDLQAFPNFDYRRQDYELFPNKVKILRGDILQLQCAYDTSDLSLVTLGGYAPSDERCFSFIMVYPKPRLSSCKSRIPDNLRDDFVQQSKTVNQSNADDIRHMDFTSSAALQAWRSFWSTRVRRITCEADDPITTELIPLSTLTNLPNITSPTPFPVCPAAKPTSTSSGARLALSVTLWVVVATKLVLLF
ncbi:DBH-like monooxygenase protein 1 isoform X2 [Corticium candelabrum]|uniref:DBH-like monooxygenase protein 1 isoform X2 n=1 Tax=Corticium candelabrum TaxID=121492 RepID=UPI002E2643E4|nr:DBH-like monooxygenase protein 1 isoform X2 [Corticium candelabrum]